MIEDFFEDLVGRVQAAGCACVITGGLACIEFGIVEHTSDCDLICQPETADALLKVLAKSRWEGHSCSFRGTMSAPLATEWLRGGWTSHFSWGEEAYLDVFGAPPRISRPWTVDSAGPYASRDQVAKMKRTRRAKDWGQATALGLQMLQKGQTEGWLHLFDVRSIQDAWSESPPDQEILKKRPSLGLVESQPALLARVVRTEIEFWTELDRLRIRIFTNAVKPYAALVRSHPALESLSLVEQNEVRLEYARTALRQDPIPSLVVQQAVTEAKQNIAVGLSPDIIELLPGVGPDFDYGGEYF